LRDAHWREDGDRERRDCACSDPLVFQPTHEQSPFDLSEAGSGFLQAIKCIGGQGEGMGRI
jgi:hypothetical protein